MPARSRRARRLAAACAVVAAAYAPSARADCSATSSQVADAVRRADDRYLAMDLDGFTGARDEAREAVDCLVIVITPADAAAFHRMEALDAFLAQDDARTIEGFRAVLALQPRHQLPDALAPKGNPLHDLFVEAAKLPPSSTEPVELSGRDQLYIDGVLIAARPTDRPTIAQITDDEGTVKVSTYLLPGEELGPPPKPRSRRGPSKTLTFAALGTGAVAAGLYGVAVQSRLSFDDPTTPRSELADLQARTNMAQWGAIGVAVVGTGLGIGAVVSAPW